MILNTNECHWVTEHSICNKLWVMCGTKSTKAMTSMLLLSGLTIFCRNHCHHHHHMSEFDCQSLISFMHRSRSRPINIKFYFHDFWRSAHLIIADFFFVFDLFSIHRSIAVKITFMLIHSYIKLIFQLFSLYVIFEYGNLFLTNFIIFL